MSIIGLMFFIPLALAVLGCIIAAMLVMVYGEEELSEASAPKAKAFKRNAVEKTSSIAADDGSFINQQFVPGTRANLTRSTSSLIKTDDFTQPQMISPTDFTMPDNFNIAELRN